MVSRDIGIVILKLFTQFLYCNQNQHYSTTKIIYTPKFQIISFLKRHNLVVLVFFKQIIYNKTHPVDIHEFPLYISIKITEANLI